MCSHFTWLCEHIKTTFLSVSFFLPVYVVLKVLKLGINVKTFRTYNVWHHIKYYLRSLRFQKLSQPHHSPPPPIRILAYDGGKGLQGDVVYMKCRPVNCFPCRHLFTNGFIFKWHDICITSSSSPTSIIFVRFLAPKPGEPCE